MRDVRQPSCRWQDASCELRLMRRETVMRYLGTALLFVVLNLGICHPASADNVATIEAIDNAAADLDEAFVKRDADAIKSLTTPDHLAVTHYYGEPKTVEEQIATLPELKYEQTNLTEPTVKLLSEDFAMRTFTAKLDGTFKGESLSARVFVTQLMQKLDGKWREKFYQLTPLKQ
jgi:ketosteroid isomerase-like protein